MITNSQRRQMEGSSKRQQINDLLGKETLEDSERTELESLTKRMQQIEVELRAAIVGEGEAEKRALEAQPDAEMRERLELRSKASLTSYLLAANAGRRVDGPEAELQAAAKVGDDIPLELWDTAKPKTEHRQTDVATAAPGTVGINLDRIRPAVFARSVLPRLGVEMPRVESGTYASATITTSLTASSRAKGARQDATAAAFTVTSVTPKSISARLGVRIEDVAAVGQANFESSLRQNLSLALSDELDKQGLNGAGGNSGADLIGLFQRLTDPMAAPATVATFDDFASVHAGGVDGLWAENIRQVGIVCGPATYGLAARTFQAAANYKGELSAAAYAMAQSGGFWTSKRMPDADTFMTVDNVQQAILYRMGRSMMGGEGAMRTAVCPHWNSIAIDDIYTDSASGRRFFTMHLLVGDVIVVQPDAYAQIAYKVSV